MSLRSKIIRLAHQKPELREALLPILKESARMGFHPLLHTVLPSNSPEWNKGDGKLSKFPIRPYFHASESWDSAYKKNDPFHAKVDKIMPRIGGTKPIKIGKKEWEYLLYKDAARFTVSDPLPKYMNSVLVELLKTLKEKGMRVSMFKDMRISLRDRRVLPNKGVYNEIHHLQVGLGHGLYFRMQSGGRKHTSEMSLYLVQGSVKKPYQESSYHVKHPKHAIKPIVKDILAHVNGENDFATDYINKSIAKSLNGWITTARLDYGGDRRVRETTHNGTTFEASVRSIGHWDQDYNDYEAEWDEPDSYIMDEDDKEKIKKHFVRYMESRSWWQDGSYSIQFTTGEKEWSYFEVTKLT